MPTRLTRRSSRPAWTFGFIFLAPSARAAERGRWARQKPSESGFCQAARSAGRIVINLIVIVIF